MTTAFYPGSFDPMTNGHLDVLLQALNMARHVVVGIGVNSSKTPLFSFDERAELIRLCLKDVLPDSAERLSVVAFSGLVVDSAREHGARLLVRGLRDGTDLDFEMQMAGMNRQMAPDVQTVFVPAEPVSRPKNRHIGAPDRPDGRRCQRFRPRRRAGSAARQIQFEGLSLEKAGPKHLPRLEIA